MRLLRMTTRLWMAAVAGAEAMFTVIYWRYCNIELWGFIVLGSILLSVNRRAR
jgi:hypothetical protein